MSRIRSTRATNLADLRPQLPEPSSEASSVAPVALSLSESTPIRRSDVSPVRTRPRVRISAPTSPSPGAVDLVRRAAPRLGKRSAPLALDASPEARVDAALQMLGTLLALRDSVDAQRNGGGAA